MSEDYFQQQVFSMLKEVTGNSNTIAVPRLFCKAMGSLTGGVFLSQLVYWCDKGTRKDGFIYKTSNEWTEETFLSNYEISKSRKLLEEIGILETKLKKANGNPTIHYKLNQKPFIDWLFKFFNKENENIDKGNSKIKESLTKTTTNITSNNTKITKGTTIKDCVRMCDFINNYNYDIEHLDNKLEAVNYYIQQFERLKKQKHIEYDANDWNYIIDNIFSNDTNNEFEDEVEIFKEVIDKHFDTDYKFFQMYYLHNFKDTTKDNRIKELIY